MAEAKGTCCKRKMVTYSIRYLFQELCLDVNATDDKAARQHWQEEVSLLLHLYFEEGGGLGPVVVL